MNLEIPIGTSHIRYQTSKGGSLDNGSLHQASTTCLLESQRRKASIPKQKRKYHASSVEDFSDVKVPVATPLYNNKYVGLNGNLAKNKVNSSIGQFEA